jgi:hypothetical protein
MPMGALILGTLSLLQAPEQAWRAVGSPASGVVSTDAWVFSGIERISNHGSKGFEMVELSECQQLSVEALVLHCVCGKGSDTNLPAEVRRIVDSAVNAWTLLQVKTAGLVWVALERTADRDRAVAALPRTACAELAALRNWAPRVVEIAEENPSWLVPAALTSVARDDAATRALLTLMTRRIDAFARQQNWPEGFVCLPQGVTAKECKALTLDELARLMELRPGDPVILMEVSNRFDGFGLTSVARELKTLPARLGWSSAAPEPNQPWLHVDCSGLKPHLVAIIRAGGAIPAQAAPASNASLKALRAFQGSPPDLVAAERLASEGAERPIPDALNLLAALRLARNDATVGQLSQALAFAYQSRNLEPRHPYADINVVRALQRLGKVEEALTELGSLPPVSVGSEDSWRAKQIKALQKVLDESSD